MQYFSGKQLLAILLHNIQKFNDKNDFRIKKDKIKVTPKNISSRVLQNDPCKFI